MSSKSRQMKKQARRWNEANLPQTKKAMKYRCEKCGKSWRMWLQTGLEEHGENHKPVPFGIMCKCGGIAYHVDWNEDIELPHPLPIMGGMSYFANDPDMDCGKPVLK